MVNVVVLGYLFLLLFVGGLGGGVVRNGKSLYYLLTLIPTITKTWSKCITIMIVIFNDTLSILYQSREYFYW